MADRAIDVGWTAPDETECVVRLRFYPGAPANRDPGGNFVDPPEDPEIEVLSVMAEDGTDRSDLIDRAQADLRLVGVAAEAVLERDMGEEEDHHEHEAERRREERHG